MSQQCKLPARGLTSLHCFSHLLQKGVGVLTALQAFCLVKYMGISVNIQNCVDDVKQMLGEGHGLRLRAHSSS